MKKFGIKHKKTIVLMLLALMLFNAFPIIDVFAHDAHFLQVVIDKKTNLYQSNVINDKASSFDAESKHIEYKYMNVGGSDMFYNYSQYYEDNISTLMPDIQRGDAGNDGKKLFTFPGFEIKGDNGKNNATVEDVNRANFIGTTLINNLNDAIIFINDGYQPEDLNQLQRLSKAVGAGEQNFQLSNSMYKYDITYGEKPSDFNIEGVDMLKKGDYGSSSFVTIKRKTNTGAVIGQRTFLFRLEKGYNTGLLDSENLNVEFRGRSYANNDAKYITWNHLVTEARILADFGIYAYNSQDMRDISTVEEKLVDLVEGFLNGVRNALGLYSLPELVFNKGIRGSNMWWHGSMSNDWRDSIQIFYNIFLALAIVIVGLAIVLNIMRVNYDTMNLNTQVDGKNAIQNLFITGFLLSLLSPFINTILRMNFKLVNVFGAVVPDLTDFSAILNYSNGLSGAFLQFVYFGIMIIYNFTYIMRALSIAMLIVTAPFFVATIALGGKFRGSFGMWLKEFISNVFIQSVHGFVLGFVLTISVSTRGIEGIVVLFGTKVLGDYLIGLITGSQNMATRMGMGAFSTVGGLATAGVGLASGALSTKQHSQGSGGKGGSSGGSGSGDSDMMSIDENDYKAPKVDTTTMGSNVSDNANTNAIDLNKDDLKETDSSSPMSQFKEGLVEESKDFMSPKNSQRGNAIKGALKVAGGGLGALTGAGLMVAGGGDPNVSGIGKKMMSGSTKGIHQGAEDVAGYGSEVLGDNSMDDYLGVGRLDNGNTAIYKDKQAMKDSGISRISNAGDDEAVFDYDTSKLGSQDQNNLEQAHYLQQVANGERQMQNGSPFSQSDRYKAKEMLNNSGIESVVKNPNSDNMSVKYNKKGLERMNLKSIRTSGRQVIEEKGHGQKLHTPKTIRSNINGNETIKNDYLSMDASRNQQEERNKFDEAFEKGEA